VEEPNDEPEARLFQLCARDDAHTIAALTTLALSAGELHGKLLREHLRNASLSETEAERTKRYLRQLREKDLLNRHELALLEEITDHVHSGAKPGPVADAVANIHWRLIDEAESPVAIAISSIAHGHTSYERHPPPTVQEGNGGPGTVTGGSGHDLEGAGIGAAIGAQIGSAGGVLGGVAGAVVGAILGGIFGSS
jgi:hypothetical protein